ncbi:hypothetical protein [Chitinophaga sp. RAB17]|uniref:hypothetical protein n=1 Tax=Chitinophaga sp. RAB17 TaxID=3233049 RepID=UPI003F92F44D
MLPKKNILLLLTTILLSCNSNSTATEAQQITDVPMAFSFLSTLPPYEEDISTTILKVFNTGSMNRAAANREDSAVVFKDANTGAVPVYPDISFFPVQNKDTLAKACSGSFRKQADLDSIAAIDFSRYFTMVVTHPPSGELSYYDILSQEHRPGDTVFLSLTSRPTNNSDGSSAVVNSFWSTCVYKAPKEHYRVLALAFRNDTTFYKLQ